MHCVGCMDVDNDTSKDDPAVNSQAAISHLQEVQIKKAAPLATGDELTVKQVVVITIQ